MGRGNFPDKRKYELRLGTCSGLHLSRKWDSFESLGDFHYGSAWLRYNQALNWQRF